MQGLEESLSVILPAYNEAENLKELIPEVISFLRSYISKFEVIVVNDGSEDGTDEILSRFCESYPELKVISYKENKGYGHAIRKGIKMQTSSGY
jgi:glycosyltransferase involved in cell wall biosynthesis